jgi:hypothetical protein
MTQHAAIVPHTRAVRGLSVTGTRVSQKVGGSAERSASIRAASASVSVDR